MQVFALHKMAMTLRTTSLLLACCSVIMVITGAARSTPTVINKESPPTATLVPLFQHEHTSKPLRILGVFPLEAYSHHILTETLMMELARRGHQVTLVSPFPPKETVPNYNHIDITDVVPKMPEIYSFEALAQEYENKNVHYVLKLLAELDGHKICQDLFNHSKIKPLLTPQHKFDVVFSEVFGSGCCFAIGTKLRVPTIATVTTHALQWLDEFNGDINNPSFIETMFYTPTKEGLTSLVQRIINTYYYLRTKWSYYQTITRPSEVVVREFLGEDGPTLDEIRKNISLFIVNTHPSLFVAKPTVPRILPVGGLHLRPPNTKKLSADVKTWLDTASNGVVYFSLGSLIRSETLPEKLSKAFLGAFKELKHLRFLWKFEATPEQAKAAGIPDNVLIVKWLPQMEVLSHPNVLAFITHGGLMGTTESIYNGVPMIGMPVFAEQLLNVDRYEKLGIAVQLDHLTVKKEDIVEAVKKATSDASIRQKIKEVSQVFKDRPMSPIDSAIWWTEYIVRNKGAHHLESPVATMPFWQYALLDVAAVVLAGLAIVFYIVYSLLRRVVRCVLRRPTYTKESKKKV